MNKIFDCVKRLVQNMCRKKQDRRVVNRIMRDEFAKHDWSRKLMLGKDQ